MFSISSFADLKDIVFCFQPHMRHIPALVDLFPDADYNLLEPITAYVGKIYGILAQRAVH